jgi:hypothetical protein
MCGIAGLQLRNPDLRPRLGELVVPMLGMLAAMAQVPLAGTNWIPGHAGR